MRNKTLVVLTPAKNEERFIKRTIHHVLAQTYPVSLYVVVDDNSTDRTVEVIRSFKDARIHIIPSRRRLALKKYEHGVPMYLAPSPHINAEVGISYLQTVYPNWDYLLKLDADTLIPPEYCERIIKRMERDPLLVMAGARYLQTPTELEIAPLFHNRNCNHIIRRTFFQEALSLGITYCLPHGELGLERYAWATGRKAMPLETLTAREQRPTSIKSYTKEDSWHITKGMEQFRLGQPLPVALHNLVLNPTKHQLLRFTGWLHAFFFRRYPELFTRKEKARLRRMFYAMFWLQRKWRKQQR